MQNLVKNKMYFKAIIIKNEFKHLNYYLLYFQ
jgi:hypothetical protein